MSLTPNADVRTHTEPMQPATLAPEETLELSNALVPPWPGRAVSLDGSVVYERDTPGTSEHAQPALYLHGLGGSSQNWTDVAGMLSRRLVGHAIDLPGFGRSAPAPRYSVDAFAARVIRWIEHAGCGPLHLVGNSLGGAIAVKVAALRPEYVRTLTLISPALPFMDPRKSVHGRFLPLLAVPRADLIAAHRFAHMDPHVLTLQVLEACFGDPSSVHPQRFEEAMREAVLRSDLPWYADAYVRTLRGLVGSFLRAYLPGSGSLWRTAARVNVPTLVIGGERDRLVDVRVAPQTARHIRGARLLILPRVGHVAQMEAPKLVARAIVGMLDEVAVNVSVKNASPKSAKTRNASLEHATALGA
jgi:pimeloyl-ACP methyl ester carboxylesterase